jgi:nuclear pore complex protein Nup98-Nup96
MFGNPQQTNSPFGTPGTTQGGTSLFGAPSTTPAFGSPAPAPAFGAPAATPSAGGFGFGSPAPAPSTGFGGFGSATPAPAPTGFGAFGSATPAPAFGAPVASTPFGAPAPAPSGGLFGSTPAPSTSGGLFGGGAASTGFGAPAAAPATSAFGAPATSAFGAPATSAFGAPAPATSAFGAPATSAFGAAPATSAFGAPAPAPSGGLFGAPAPATSAFGAPAPAGGMFGAPAPAAGGMFGAPAPAAGGMFGAPAPAAGKAGTLQVPYSDTRVNDGSVSINFKSISAMPAYTSKSFEEWRIDDYMAGNKGSQGQSSTFGAPAPSAFGSPAPAAGGLFGAPAPATSTFGAPAPATSAFGAPAPAFGAPAPATNTFGAAPAPSGGLFGAPAPAAGGLFGAPAPAPAAGGLFGAPAPAPATGGLFGAPAPAPAAGGLFGAPAPAPASGGLFGAPAPAPAGGLFGAPAPAPAGGLFGAPAPAPAGGLFGSPAPAPAGGLFGAPAPAPTGGLFGAPAAAPTGGLFGTPAPAPAAGGLFGAPAPAPAGGLFGAPAPTTFGAPAPTPMYGAAPGVSTGAVAATTVLVPPSADTLLAQQLAAVETQKKEMAVLEAMRGSSPGNIKGSSSGQVIPTSIFQRDAAAVRYRGLAGGGGTSRSALSYPQQMPPRSTAKVHPRGFGPLTSSTTLQISNSRSKSAAMTPSAFIGSSTKHLVIKPGSLTPKPKVRLLLTDESYEKSIHTDQNGNGHSIQSPETNGVIHGRITETGQSNTPASQKDISSSSASAQKSSPFGVSRIANDEAAFTSPEAISTTQRHVEETPKSASTTKKTTPTSNDEAYDYYRTVIGSPPMSEVQNENQTPIQQGLSPTLTKEGYVVTPSIGVLSSMSEADLAAVSNFSVEKVGIGSVKWDGAVDVRGIDLDSIITIKDKDVSVYYKQEDMGTKPAEGTKLNRPAVITFHKVFPKDGPQSSVEMKKLYEKKLKRCTEKMDAEFIMYDADTGIWMFRVHHFSRYALDDDSDEEEQQEESKAEIPQNQDFESGVSGGPTQLTIGLSGQGNKRKSRLSRIRVPMDEDEDMLEDTEEKSIPLKSDAKDHVLQAAEAAYAKMAQIGNGVSELEMMDTSEQRSMYVDEGESGYDYNIAQPASIIVKPSEVKSTFSVCGEIAKRCGLKNTTSSSTDYALRMGRSFRIGWKPDGSLLSPTTLQGTRNDKVMQMRPQTTPVEMSTDFLSAHLIHSSRIYKDSEVPIFVVPTCQNHHTNTNKTNATLSNMLDMYKRACKKNSDKKSDDPVNDVILQAFSLIQILFQSGSLSQRQICQSFSNWLRDVCSKSVEHDIYLANGTNNCYDAIFAALSGGDKMKASSLARENGLMNLSVIIANATPQSSSDLTTQINSWFECDSSQYMPPQLERVYSFLSRDLGLEENLYQSSAPNYKQSLDWRRRLTMLEECEIGNMEDSSDSMISSLLTRYDSDVADAKAPPANAWYIASRSPEPHEYNQEEKCTLYRIMKLFLEIETGNGKNNPLSHVISPYGHTPHPHNVSHSFHLASALSALQLCCKPLSESEEYRLLETYALNLINDGKWEWAVYVILCTFSED